MNLIIIGNIIGLVGSLFMVIGGYLKNKNQAIIAQTLQLLSLSISNLILGSISGFINNLINCVRNIFSVKGKLTWLVKIIIIILSIILTIRFNNLGIIGYLPLINNIIFILCMNTKSDFNFKLLTIFYMILWLIHNIYIKAYTTSIFNCITIITCLIAMNKIISSNKENKIIVVNKPGGCTSRDVVNKIGGILKTKRIGHTGTLDPLATGVLIVTTGKYTKLNDVIMSTYKEYIAEFQFGLLTDTLDITGKTLKQNKKKISEKKLKEALTYFTKTYDQEVPLYSSVKVHGRKLYEYARNNEKVTLPKRSVDIKELELLDYHDNIARVRCLVSKGTYIRSLIRDIGTYLNTIATMSNLTRTKQGNFSIDQSYTLKDIENNKYKSLSIADVLDVTIISNYPDLSKIRNGAKITYASNKEYLLFKDKNKEVALYKRDKDIYRMFIMLEKR